MEQTDFKKTIEYLSDTGYKPLPDGISIRIPDAKVNLMNGIRYFRGDNARWMSGYDRIAEWLTDNKRKGLMLTGGCGLGKSLIGMRIIPLLINHYCQLITHTYTAVEINTNPDEVLQYKVVYIDDVGTEDVSNVYGNRRVPFAEIVDATERDGKLLMFSTNLDEDHIKAKYGERVLDRLRAVTRKITLQGKSMRMRI